jgi:thioredoxin reductase (NADPH)
MVHTIVIGDGPAGLSAALFLARAQGHTVTVYGADGTGLHWALVHNYLGLPDVLGDDLYRTGLDQARQAGADLVEAKVAGVRASAGGFTVTLEDGTTAPADYLVLAGGKGAGGLAADLGLEAGAEGVATDREGRTVVDGLYVVGRTARPNRSHAILSAGAGAAAAVDIICREAGREVTDWDSPPSEAAQPPG